MRKSCHEETSSYVNAVVKDGGKSQLDINENGGLMAIFNNGEENVLQASVADDDGGIIMTRDKNGYRTGTLP